MPRSRVRVPPQPPVQALVPSLVSSIPSPVSYAIRADFRSVLHMDWEFQTQRGLPWQDLDAGIRGRTPTPSLAGPPAPDSELPNTVTERSFPASPSIHAMGRS